MATAVSRVNGAIRTIVAVVAMVKVLSGQKGKKRPGNSCAVLSFCSMTRGWAECWWEHGQGDVRPCSHPRPVTFTCSDRNGRHQLEPFVPHLYPIVLAWAVTIDKVQALSLHRLVISGVIFGIMVKPILL